MRGSRFQYNMLLIELVFKFSKKAVLHFVTCGKNLIIVIALKAAKFYVFISSICIKTTS